MHSQSRPPRRTTKQHVQPSEFPSKFSDSTEAACILEETFVGLLFNPINLQWETPDYSQTPASSNVSVNM